MLEHSRIFNHLSKRHDITMFFTCVGLIAMLLVLYSESSRGTDCSALNNSQLEEICEDVRVLKGQNWSYGLNHYGYHTDYPLYLLADTDDDSNTEDIIFGFDAKLRGIDSYPADASSVKERMRLTDEGRLGIGTNNPNSLLDVRANHGGTQHQYYHTSSSLARLGIAKRWFTSSAHHLNYHGFDIRVHGHGRGNSGHQSLETRIGFNLTNASKTKQIVSDDHATYGMPNLDKPDELDRFIEKRVMTMRFDPSSQEASVAVAYNEDHSPTETLDVNGAIRIGNTSNQNAGTLRYNDDNFEGYNGSEWLNLGSAIGDSDIVMRSGHQLIFGSTASHRTPNNFLVNSLNVPDANVAEFPIPGESGNYNDDDEGTSGGMALITGGLPRFTVKGNGNTYVHKRLSIGIGGHVDGTVMTVAGAVHIGPDNLKSTTFDYDDNLENYLLWVENGIVSEDFAIAGTDDWSDHVLQDSYDLKPLSEVEAFIQEEGHLPGVPSAEEVKDNGYTVHEMTRTLLEKVEELTLHTIAQQKALEEQQAEILNLRSLLNERPLITQVETHNIKTQF